MVKLTLTQIMGMGSILFIYVTTDAMLDFDINANGDIDAPYECTWMFNFYRPQRSTGKVIFSQASVILSTGGGCCSRGGVCLPWGSTLGGAWSGGGAWWRPLGMSTAAGGMHPTGMHSCDRNWFIEQGPGKPWKVAVHLENLGKWNFCDFEWNSQKMALNFLLPSWRLE